MVLNAPGQHYGTRKTPHRKCIQCGSLINIKMIDSIGCIYNIKKNTAMRRAWLFSAIVLLSPVIVAQDYQISFAILDDNETIVDSVVVHNMKQGNIITLQGNDILHLVASTTGISNLNTLNGKVEVYPNPFSDRATIEFQNNKQGVVQLSLYDMAGKLVAQNRLFHSAGKTIAELRGVPAGAYVIQIDTETSIFSEVILSNDASRPNPEIIFKGSGNNAGASSPILKSSDIEAPVTTTSHRPSSAINCLNLLSHPE